MSFINYVIDWWWENDCPVETARFINHLLDRLEQEQIERFN